MKKLLIVFSLIVLLCFSFSCQKQEQVERFMEDGEEVVVNHVEPYKIKGEPSSLIFEKEISIDMERDDIANIGLTNIRYFDADDLTSLF